MTKYSASFRLFTVPTFWEGFGRIIDLIGTMNDYNVSQTPQEADAKALRSDWEALRFDARTAFYGIISSNERVAESL